MNLQRMKQLAGIKLNESVSAIPGIGRKLSEEVDSSEVRDLANKLSAGEITYDEFKDQLDSLEHTDYSMRQGEMGNPDRQEHLAWGKEQHDWPEDDQEFSDQEEFDESSIEMDEKAPPGMEDTVMKLKKEYPGDESKAFATAWSIYNKKHGKTDEDTGIDDLFNSDEDDNFGEPNADGSYGNRYEPIPHPGDGEVDESMEDYNEWDEPYDDREVCPSCNGAGEQGRGLLTHQCDTCHGSGYADGDSDEENFTIPDDDDEVSPYYDGMEESFDFNNGYNDINHANGGDYFPNGADSPVVSNTGPSGARQGDNPQQKKMQVSEVHKELVYGYRSYLKESKKRK